MTAEIFPMRIYFYMMLLSVGATSLIFFFTAWGLGADKALMLPGGAMGAASAIPYLLLQKYKTQKMSVICSVIVCLLTVATTHFAISWVI